MGPEDVVGEVGDRGDHRHVDLSPAAQDPEDVGQGRVRGDNDVGVALVHAAEHAPGADEAQAAQTHHADRGDPGDQRVEQPVHPREETQLDAVAVADHVLGNAAEPLQALGHLDLGLGVGGSDLGRHGAGCGSVAFADVGGEDQDPRRTGRFRGRCAVAVARRAPARQQERQRALAAGRRGGHVRVGGGRVAILLQRMGIGLVGHAQAVLQRPGGREAQRPRGQPGVQARAANLALALGRVLGLDVRICHPGQRRQQVPDRGLAAGADVEGAGGVGLGGREEPAHDVLDVHVVARARAVAENGGSGALGQRPREDRHHAALAARVLARAVHVGQAQRDGGHLRPPVALDLVLGRALVGAVGGQRLHWRGLRRRQLVGVAVQGAAGGGEDEPLGARGARRLEHVDRPAAVDLGVEVGVGDRAAYVGLRGEMEDDVGPRLAQQSAHGAGVAHVGLLERGAVAQGAGQVLPPPAREVVDCQHLVAPGDEGVDQVGSDETRAACDYGPAGSCAISWHA